MRKFTNAKSTYDARQLKKGTTSLEQHSVACLDERRKVIQTIMKLRAPHFGGYDLFKKERDSEIRMRAGRITDSKPLVAYNKAAGELYQLETKADWETRARSAINIYQ